MKTGLWTVVAVAMGLFGYGCGGMTCEEICEAGQECDGAEPADCADSCADLEELNDKADCGTQFDAMLTCVSDHEDEICSEESEICMAESGAYMGCVLGYCMGHESDPVCTE